MGSRQSRASLAMGRYARGDEAAFEDLYDALAPPIGRYLSRVTRNPSTLDDLLQQVFMSIHTSRERFRDGSPVEPWAFTIARATAMEWLRREYRPRDLPLGAELTPGPLGPRPDVELFASEMSSALDEALDELSPRLRDAFILVRVRGLSHAEAARALGIQESASKVRAHRATRQLRRNLRRFHPRNPAAEG